MLFVDKDVPDDDWIVGPSGEWYSNQLDIPPSVAHKLGLPTGYTSDASFASLGANLSSDASVSDTSIVRIDGPLEWIVHQRARQGELSLASEAQNQTDLKTAAAFVRNFEG